MKRINRFWSLILSCAFCMSLCVPSFAADKASNESLLLAESFIPTSNNNAVESSAPSDNGHLINADGTTSSTTIDDIDRIIHERDRAFLEGNTSKVNQYQQQLRNAGATPSTLSEISVSAGNVDTQSLKRIVSSATFDTYTYYAYANGTRYQIKRITANPSINSNLYHSASVNKKTISSSLSAGTYELFKVMGSAAIGSAGKIAETCITAYEAFKSVISGLTPSTTIYDITATYACAALEQVSFYQYQTSDGVWNPFASSSYVQTAISGTVFDVNYSGGSKKGLNMAVSGSENTLYSPYSLKSDYSGYDTGDMLERYFTSYIFDKNSQVMGISFYHNANGTVKTITTFGMVCPTTTVDIT